MSISVLPPAAQLQLVEQMNLPSVTPEADNLFKFRDGSFRDMIAFSAERDSSSDEKIVLYTLFS